ncbi:hypothetical protein [Actinomadura fibrosa]|uniref:Protein kinase domain-containing protein n=1 Tax=Actinomadura fibrosa TaxID=111802 RepID=A0ABW2XZD0_9ACTN|nr:hypothetical protein [Actinomadura fibrosa]
MSGETSHQEHIGPYRLLSRLGGGPAGGPGRGVRGGVHRAAGPDGRDVALRPLPPGAAPDIARMRGVLSPYVADVLDGEHASGRPYVVFRFVPGRPLAEHVAERGPLGGDELRRMALGLAKGLAAIHEAGLAHGELGPGTVLVVDGAPVIVDFALTAGAAAHDDLPAWAATVAFAATGRPDARAAHLPGDLRSLVEAAAHPDPAARPSAAELALAAARLDLPAIPAARPAPEAHPALGPGKGSTAPTGPAAPDSKVNAVSADASGAALGGTVTGGDQGGRGATGGAGHAAEHGTGAVEAHELAVARGWARLLAAMVVVIGIGAAVMMPIVGLVLTLGAVTLLRAVAATTVRGRVWAFGRTLLTVPYAAVLAVAVPLALVAVSAVGGEIDSSGACALGAGAGAAVLWTAPGVGGPRRQLERAFLGIARRPRYIGIAVTVLGVLAVLAAFGAATLTPSFAPMYGLQSSLESLVDRLQNAVHSP